MTRSLIDGIEDPLVREGVEAAIAKTLEAAAVQKAYPGHFTVVADGSHFGSENTWPGLDSWEMAGAYLLLGAERLVLDYFEFVQASQRQDGNIPFAIFPAETPPEGMSDYLQGLRYPEDVYTYTPVPRQGQPGHSNMSSRKWIGLIEHWQPKANPLSVLAPICYIMTASEIVATTQSDAWLAEKLASLEAAGNYLLSRKSGNGLISGAGFYIECPPRHQWDGVTQCFCVQAFRLLSELNTRLGRGQAAALWTQQANTLADVFRGIFWRGDHFAEYVHPDHGVVDLHGLSDVNWAAVAFDVATEAQANTLWPLMLAAKELWHGDMPTQLVSRPFVYRDWEHHEPLSFEKHTGPLYDVAAMGRVWYLEALACLKMGAHDRVRESVRMVCRMGERHDGFWHERYHPLQVCDVYPAGPRGYCEYAAILVRIVLGNPALFRAGR